MDLQHPARPRRNSNTRQPEGLKNKNTETFRATTPAGRVDDLSRERELTDEEVSRLPAPGKPKESVRFVMPDPPLPPKKLVPATKLPYKDVPPLEFVAAPKEPLRVPHEPAYKHVAPIENTGKVLDLTARLMDVPISLTTEEIMRASPLLKEELRRLLSKKRVPTSQKVTMVEEIDEDFLPRSESAAEQRLASEPIDESLLDISDLPMVDTFLVADGSDGLTKGCMVARDPYLQYLGGLAS